MLRTFFVVLLLATFSFVAFAIPPALPANPSLPPNTRAILDHIYDGRSDLAIPEARQMQQQFPDLPLGYILEDEALWWKIWCSAAEFKYGMTMPRHREKLPGDQHYLEVAAKAYALAETSLARQESAEMYLYAGMADALTARLYSLRGEARSTARMGVRARGNFERALALDPSVADADLGLGLYNYYVDTLSTMARVMRFFMGIPGGSKEEGIRQLQRAIREGQIAPAAARYYLALNLHNYDQRYQEALQVLEPLVTQYPGNPLFHLGVGDLYAKLGQRQQAASSYNAAAAAAAKLPDENCRAKVDLLVRESLAAVGGGSAASKP
jgi:tetratricopeptide (TPR) repeat protein